MRTLFLAAVLGFLGLQTPQTQQARNGVIQVTVKDSATRAHIPGARIALVVHQTVPPNVMTDAITDENGRVIFKNLPFGNYSVDAEKLGYVRVNPSITIQSVAFDETKRNHELGFVLDRSVWVQGLVFDSTARLWRTRTFRHCR